MQIQQFVYKCHQFFSFLNSSVCNYSFWDCSDPQMEASQDFRLEIAATLEIYCVIVLRTCRYMLNPQVKHDIAVKYIGLFGSHCASYYLCDLSKLCSCSWLLKMADLSAYPHLISCRDLSRVLTALQYFDPLRPDAACKYFHLSDLLPYLSVFSFSPRCDLSVFIWHHHYIS